MLQIIAKYNFPYRYLRIVELIVKIQKEGSSKIGIKFAQEYQAITRYEEMLKNQAGNSFALTIELIGNKLSLLLMSDATNIKTQYKDISYSSSQMSKLITAIETFQSFQFLHVFAKNNVLMVAKPYRTESFIKLSKIEILNPVNI